MNTSKKEYSGIETSCPNRSQVKCILRGAEGFTLVEALVAMVIMALCLGSVVYMFSQGKSFLKGQGDRRVATNLAQERLEYVNSFIFSDLIDSVSNCSRICNDTEENIVCSTGTMTITETAIHDDNCNIMDGNGGRPDYSAYQRVTSVAFVEDDPVTTSEIELNIPCDPSVTPCNYMRIRVTVYSDKTADQAGYVEEVSLSTVRSRWR